MPKQRIKDPHIMCYTPHLCLYFKLTTLAKTTEDAFFQLLLERVLVGAPRSKILSPSVLGLESPEP